MLDECRDLSFEIAGEDVDLEQDAVLQRLIPTPDLAFRPGMTGSAAGAFHVFVG